MTTPEFAPRGNSEDLEIDLGPLIKPSETDKMRARFAGKDAISEPVTPIKTIDIPEGQFLDITASEQGIINEAIDEDNDKAELARAKQTYDRRQQLRAQKPEITPADVASMNNRIAAGRGDVKKQSIWGWVKSLF